MGFRHCFNNLPIDQCALPDGPRQGNISRSGYEVAWDAAGNAFPKGEYDSRVANTIHNVPHKRDKSSIVFDRDGAAGCGSPRDEVRAFTIDDHNRRARSEPPKPQISRVTQLQTMNAFGVPLDIDSGLCGRRQRCDTEPNERNRQQDSQQAMRFQDIDGLLTRRHFVGSRGPREILSPRLESVGLETIDIDARVRKRQVVTKTSADAILPSSACYSLACEVNHGAWRQAPRSHSFDYFEKTLQAERYAKLLGRPNINSDKEFNRTRLAALVEEQQKEKISEESWMLDTIVGSDLVDMDGPSAKNRTFSTVSTTASDVSCSPLPDESRRRTISFSKLEEVSDEVGEDSQEKENALPLNLRRVVASLGVHNFEMLGSNAKRLEQQIRESSKRKPSGGARLRVGSRGRTRA